MFDIDLIIVFMYVFLGNYCPVCRKCYEENDYESEVSYRKYILVSHAAFIIELCSKFYSLIKM